MATVVSDEVRSIVAECVRKRPGSDAHSLVNLFNGLARDAGSAPYARPSQVLAVVLSQMAKEGELSCIEFTYENVKRRIYFPHDCEIVHEFFGRRKIQ